MIQQLAREYAGCSGTVCLPERRVLCPASCVLCPVSCVLCPVAHDTHVLQAVCLRVVHRQASTEQRGRGDEHLDLAQRPYQTEDNGTPLLLTTGIRHQTVLSRV
jgi:hypothetical protein